MKKFRTLRSEHWLMNRLINNLFKEIKKSIPGKEWILICLFEKMCSKVLIKRIIQIPLQIQSQPQLRGVV